MDVGFVQQREEVLLNVFILGPIIEVVEGVADVVGNILNLKCLCFLPVKSILIRKYSSRKNTPFIKNAKILDAGMDKFLNMP